MTRFGIGRENPQRDKNDRRSASGWRNTDRLGFWTLPSEKNRAIRKAAAKTPFHRRCDVDTVAMNLEVIWEMSDQAFGTLASCRDRPPRLDEHTYEVLEELLGFSGARLAALKDEGIV